MAIDMGLPFLGRIPIDPEIVMSGDEEQPNMYFYPKTGGRKNLMRLWSESKGTNLLLFHSHRTITKANNFHRRKEKSHEDRFCSSGK